MIAYIILFISYAVISFILKIIILSPVIKVIQNMDIKASVPPESQLASPVFTVYSAIKICILFYVMFLINDSSLSFIFIGLLGSCEIGLGLMNMLTSDTMKMPHLRNVNTATTIGAIIGYCAVVAHLFFNA